MRFQLADGATRLAAARLLVYNAARLRDAGLPFVKEAAMAKLYASEAAEKICAMAVEVFGGNGYSTTRSRSTTATSRSGRSTRARRSRLDDRCRPDE
jgi:alkylation response protein AidB-like acyl-CoA dehydrogenase